MNNCEKISRESQVCEHPFSTSGIVAAVSDGSVGKVFLDAFKLVIGRKFGLGISLLRPLQQITF